MSQPPSPQSTASTSNAAPCVYEIPLDDTSPIIPERLRKRLNEGFAQIHTSLLTEIMRYRSTFGAAKADSLIERKFDSLDSAVKVCLYIYHLIPSNLFVSIFSVMWVLPLI